MIGITDSGSCYIVPYEDEQFKLTGGEITERGVHSIGSFTGSGNPSVVSVQGQTDHGLACHMVLIRSVACLEPRNNPAVHSMNVPKSRSHRLRNVKGLISTPNEQRGICSRRAAVMSQ